MKRAFITITCLLIILSSVTIGIIITSFKNNTNNKDNIQEDTFDNVETPVPPAVETSKHVDSISTYAISVTAEEREMLARLVFLESSICSDKCQKAVASVVFNRLHSGRWRKDVNNDGEITLYDIIYYPNAFTPAKYISTTTPNQAAYDAVDYVLKNGVTVPTEVRYFRTDYDFSWENYENYCVIDNVYFGYFTNWKQGAW